LQVQGVLNRFTYLAFMAKAQESYAHGARYLLLDLRQTRQIELSGLFALVSIARLFGGEEPLDPEGGWAVLHAAAGEFNETMEQRVKLLALSPEVRRTLTNSCFCQRLPIYDDETAALAAFQQLPAQS
jgi:anti-anti-sigma regulatory factor